MALELKQSLKLTQKLVMTPQLRQAIKLLQLGRLELSDTLRAEMEQNPMLEEIMPVQDESGHPEALSREENLPENELPVTTQVGADVVSSLGEVNWEEYANNFEADFSFAKEAPPADAPSQFDFISATPGLDAHLHWQLKHLTLTEQDQQLTHFIIGNLDGHGFLAMDLEEMCTHCQCSMEEAEGALRLVQSLDPAGVAARDIRESLLLQLDRLEEEDELAVRIVADHMHLLERRNIPQMARELGTSQQRVAESLRIIQELAPYPGNEYSNEQTKYVSPDAYVLKIGDEYIIQLTSDGRPHLGLSEECLSRLKQKKVLTQESRAYLQENKRNAEWIIKSVEQRQRTIYKVVESLLKFQRDFFEVGPLAMKPLVLRDVADDIGMHESTISRVTANKYVHTPQGIYELKFFFNASITNADGEAVGAEAIKTRIRQLVGGESPAKPLSDNRISELLAEENMQVARRTVAKYREQMKILPVKHRRQAVLSKRTAS